MAKPQRKRLRTTDSTVPIRRSVPPKPHHLQQRFMLPPAKSMDEFIMAGIKCMDINVQR